MRCYGCATTPRVDCEPKALLGIEHISCFLMLSLAFSCPFTHLPCRSWDYGHALWCCRPKPAEFMAKVPSGLLPVIEIDGRNMTESATIMAFLEQACSSLKPALHPICEPVTCPASSQPPFLRLFVGLSCTVRALFGHSGAPQLAYLSRAIAKPRHAGSRHTRSTRPCRCRSGIQTTRGISRCSAWSGDYSATGYSGSPTAGVQQPVHV